MYKLKEYPKSLSTVILDDTAKQEIPKTKKGPPKGNYWNLCGQQDTKYYEIKVDCKPLSTVNWNKTAKQSTVM